MKIYLLIPIFIFLLFSCNQTKMLNQKIDSKNLQNKHWASTRLGSGDTVIYESVKAENEDVYKYATGHMDGYDFLSNDTCLMYYNMMCSDENGARPSEKKWYLKNDTLTIDSDYGTNTYLILELTKKQLILKEISVESNK